MVNMRGFLRNVTGEPITTRRGIGPGGFEMSRTYRACPDNCVRSPRGRRRAIIQGARPGAIPPDPWDDVPINNECWMPQKVARKYLAYGMLPQRVAEMIGKRFHIDIARAKDICRIILRRYRWTE